MTRIIRYIPGQFCFHFSGLVGIHRTRAGMGRRGFLTVAERMFSVTFRNENCVVSGAYHHAPGHGCLQYNDYLNVGQRLGRGLESAPSPLLLRKYACYCTETRLIWSVKCLPHCSGSHVPTMTTYRVKMASYISNIRIMDFSIFQNVRKSPKLI